MHEQSVSPYEGKTRVRACGVCIRNDALLLVKHSNIGELGTLWIPPGGGVEYGESCEAALKREFLEETGLVTNVGPLLYVCEYIGKSLHAVELFFIVNIESGELKLGSDPELSKSDQIIEEVQFVTFENLKVMDKQTLHNSLRKVTDKDSLLNMSGYFKFCQ